jgi:hypothetical protein
MPLGHDPDGRRVRGRGFRQEALRGQHHPQRWVGRGAGRVGFTLGVGSVDCPVRPTKTLIGWSQPLTALTTALMSMSNAGESMEQALRDCCKGVKIGKILVVRKHQRKGALDGCGGAGSPAAAAAAAAGNGLGGGRGRVVVSALSSTSSSSSRSASSLCLDENAQTPSPGGAGPSPASVGSDADGWITSQVRLFQSFSCLVGRGSFPSVGWVVWGLRQPSTPPCRSNQPIAVIQPITMTNPPPGRDLREAARRHRRPLGDADGPHPVDRQLGGRRGGGEGAVLDGFVGALDSSD